MNWLKEYENQIDIMVYKLYNLTYSEVQTIDPTFPSIMSEEEYNNYILWGFLWRINIIKFFMKNTQDKA